MPLRSPSVIKRRFSGVNTLIYVLNEFRADIEQLVQKLGRVSEDGISEFITKLILDLSDKRLKNLLPEMRGSGFVRIFVCYQPGWVLKTGQAACSKKGVDDIPQAVGWFVHSVKRRLHRIPAR